jgi:hypothetical protein
VPRTRDVGPDPFTKSPGKLFNSELHCGVVSALNEILRLDPRRRLGAPFPAERPAHVALAVRRLACWPRRRRNNDGRPVSMRPRHHMSVPVLARELDERFASARARLRRARQRCAAHRRARRNTRAQRDGRWRCARRRDKAISVRPRLSWLMRAPAIIALFALSSPAMIRRSSASAPQRAAHRNGKWRCAGCEERPSVRAPARVVSHRRARGERRDQGRAPVSTLGRDARAPRDGMRR